MIALSFTVVFVCYGLFDLNFQALSNDDGAIVDNDFQFFLLFFISYFNMNKYVYICNENCLNNAVSTS